MIIISVLFLYRSLFAAESLKDSTSESSIQKDSSLIQSLEKRVSELESLLAENPSKKYTHHPIDVAFLNYKDRKRILITGGAGFVGSHLTDKLMLEGHEVIVADNMFTGRKRNVEHWIGEYS